MFRFWFRSLLLFALLAAGASFLFAAPGELDMTFAGFGTAGKVITNQPSGWFALDMAQQPDGKIVVAGRTVHSLLVMRYLPDGRLDTTFGNGGLATFGPNELNVEYDVAATAVAIQPDGNIVVAGWAENQPADEYEADDLLLARVTASGALDTSFGGGAGFVITDFDNDSDWASAVLVQTTDSKIVVAGYAQEGGADGDFAVARYHPDGSPDTSFGGDGKVMIGFGDDEWATDVALQEEGKLVVVGSRGEGDDTDFAVARLNGDGTLDNSFHIDGKVTTGFGGYDFGQAVSIQPDGKIVVAGNDRDSSLVARYLPNGALDNSFDGDGKRSIASLSGQIDDVALQPDGKIVLLGNHQSPDGDTKLTLYRLNPDGSTDASFGGTGNVLIDVGGWDRGYALGLLADGRILASGMSDSNHVMVRLWPDGSFDGGGQQALGFQDPDFGPGAREVASALALEPDGNLVLAGSIANAALTQYDFALARFLPDGLLDTSFGQQGHTSFGYGGKEEAVAVLRQPDGKIVAAGTVDTGSAINFMVARFNTNGEPDISFNVFGFNVVDFLGGRDFAQGAALAPDGKIVVAGSAYNGARNVFGVVRFNVDGSVDNSFDVDGKQLFEFDPMLEDHIASAVVVQPDRRIVLGGRAGGNFALVRLNENGSVDGSFGSGGTTVTDMGGFDTIEALALDGEGRVLAAGIRGGDNYDFALARYTADGILDPSFGTDGRVFADFGGADLAFALDVRGDGTIVLAGCANYDSFALAQFLADGQPDTAFNGTGRATTEFVGAGECAQAVRFVGPDKIIAAGYQVVEGKDNMALARFQTTIDSSNPDEALAGLAASNNSPTQLGQTTTLSATITAGTNVSYAWDFGDGQTGSGAVVSHVYAAAGSYTAVVTATNTVSSMSATTMVTVQDEPRQLYLPLLLIP